jgi:hypothetical protein
VYLLAGDILATVAVGFGIIWEHGSAAVRVVANRLVIGGIILETLCSALLFAYDANVIGRQNDKIIALERRLAARALTEEQKAVIALRLKQFPPQTIQIIPYWQDKESLDIANAIADAVLKDDWKIHNPERFTSLIGVVAGVYIRVDTNASDAAKGAAKELSAALNDNDVAATEQEGDNGPPNDPLTEQISKQVGIKP